MNKPINLYAEYIRQKYRERVQKITVLGGFTCPNRDGSKGHGGCIYCNNETFSAPIAIKDWSITDQINHGIEVSKLRYNAKKFIVYFQAYSNTYAPIARLKELYKEALNHPAVIGLSIGTRPDCIDREKLQYLAQLNQKYDITLEYGMESTFDTTLQKINRGHTFADFVSTVELTAQFKIPICAHLILGFPWETLENTVTSAKKIAKMPINFLKIHQLHVVKDTPLEQEYLKGNFPIYSQEEYVSHLIALLEHLPPQMVIQRLFGSAPENMLVSPPWEMSSSQFIQFICARMIKQNTWQGKFWPSK